MCLHANRHKPPQELLENFNIFRSRNKLFQPYSKTNISFPINDLLGEANAHPPHIFHDIHISRMIPFPNPIRVFHWRPKFCQLHMISRSPREPNGENYFVYDLRSKKILPMPFNKGFSSKLGSLLQCRSRQLNGLASTFSLTQSETSPFNPAQSCRIQSPKSSACTVSE